MSDVQVPEILGRDPDAPPEAPSHGVRDRDVQQSYFVMRLAGSTYAVAAEQVEHIAPPEKPVRVPTAPGSVLGIVHLRGRIVTVIDARQILQLPAPVETSGEGLDRRLVVMQARGSLFAILADKVLGLSDISLRRIHMRGGANDGVDEAAIVAGEFEHEGDLVTALRVEALLDKVTG